MVSGAPARRIPSFASTDRGAGALVRKCTCEPGGSAMHAAIVDKKDELAELRRRYGVSSSRSSAPQRAVWISIQRPATPTFLWNSSLPVNSCRSISTSISPMLCAAPSTDPSIWSNPAQSRTRTCARPSSASIRVASYLMGLTPPLRPRPYPTLKTSGILTRSSRMRKKMPNDPRSSRTPSAP